MIEWKQVVGYEGRYMVSSMGHVQNVATGRLLKPTKLNTGYWIVSLQAADKRWTNILVHRLVALAFLGPEPPRHEVNHKNMNRADPRLENLEYVTRQQNIRHGDLGRGGKRKPRLTTA